MPIYDYVCAACRHRIEVIHRIDADGPRFCPSCGAEGTMRKAVATPAVHFKGSGWAKKDRSSASSTRIRSGSESSGGGGEGSGSAGSSAGSSGDSSGGSADAAPTATGMGDRTTSGDTKSASDAAGPARPGNDSSKGGGKSARSSDD